MPRMIRYSRPVYPKEAKNAHHGADRGTHGSNHSIRQSLVMPTRPLAMPVGSGDMNRPNCVE
jgi:hypothetical protein